MLQYISTQTVQSPPTGYHPNMTQHLHTLQCISSQKVHVLRVEVLLRGHAHSIEDKHSLLGMIGSRLRRLYLAIHICLKKHINMYFIQCIFPSYNVSLCCQCAARLNTHTHTHTCICLDRSLDKRLQTRETSDRNVHVINQVFIVSCLKNNNKQTSQHRKAVQRNSGLISDLF